MESTPDSTATRRWPSRVPLSARGAILLAIAFGLSGGYLDIAFIVLKKYVWNDSHYLETGRDFLWSVPLATWFCSWSRERWWPFLPGGGQHVFRGGWA